MFHLNRVKEENLTEILKVLGVSLIFLNDIIECWLTHDLTDGVTRNESNTERI